MSLILPSTTSPLPSGNTSASSAARQGESGQNDADGFGEVLSRSMEPVRETSDKTTAKTPAPSSKRPAADDRKTDADGLVNIMALALPPLDTITTRGLAPGSAATVPATSPPAIAATVLADLQESEPGAAAAVTQPLEAAADADAADGLGLLPVLAATAQKDGAQGSVQSKPGAANGTPSLPVDLATMASAATATDTGTPDQPAQHEHTGRPAVNAVAEAEAETGPSIATPQTSGKAPATSAALAPAVPLAPASNAAAPEDTAGPNGVSPVPSMGAGVQVQNATAVSASSAPLPVATATLAPEVGSNAWGKALGQQVIHLGTTGQQVAELQLNPPGLGPLKVTLSMNEHQMQAMFVSAHASVRSAVEAALPQLRTTLADNGISLGNTSVSSDSQQQPAFAGQQDRQPARTYRGDSPAAAAAPALPARPVAESPRRIGGAGVDTYA